MAEETTNKDNIDVNDPFSDKSMFAVDKGIDTTDIDKAISGLEKPASGSVYDKLAARYRSQGAGAVLRTQKNLANLFLPTVNLIQEREADALARYTLFKQGLEDFDDSTIFGQADGSEMPIVDEIKSLANMTKEDMRELSRLKPADERYDVLAKKIQKNNEAIANFDDINQKLLEIRNAQDGSDDASQWSKGMTQTERDMWMDIYTGKGNNIKIQDGKLVWTNTKTTTSYEFEGGNFEDDKYKALGGTRTDLGYLAYWTRGEDGNQLTFKNGQKGDNIKTVQEGLIKGGFTDADGNELEADGEWGPKSQAAYDKYLAQKDELETAWLDENLTDEEKKKYGTTTGGGETRVIDLNNISGGPTMIENGATITERKIQGGVQDLINSGVGIDDPNYQRTVKSMIYQLNQTGPAGIKSLIFDGLNTDDDDIFTSENTNSFIEGVIANNAKEFGIKDPENMTEQELESAIEKLKEGDVTIQYNNSEGKKESLQRQYLHWYKSQIDAKVEAGVKSKFSSTTGELKNEDDDSQTTNKNNNQTTTTTSTTTDNEIDTTVADNFVDRFGTDVDQMFGELTTEDSTYVGGGGNDGTTSGLLFNYGDNEFVENTLNRTYGVSAEEFGDVTSSGQDAEGARMSFHFEALDYLSGGFGDRLDVYYRDFNGTVHKKRFEFDNTGDTDFEQSQALQQWMRGKIKDDQRFVKGITSSNAKKYVPKDTSGGGSYDPNENTTQTTNTSAVDTSTTDTSDTTGTFRDTMSSSDQGRVNKFKIVGTSGAGKANIFKNNKPIRAKVDGPGGFVTVNITGVRAEGDNLVVGTSMGDQDLGRFEKRGDKYVFVPGNAYKYLEGEDKKDFDAFKTAIETDTTFAEEVRGSVTGTSIFNTSNY